MVRPSPHVRQTNFFFQYSITNTTELQPTEQVCTQIRLRGSYTRHHLTQNYPFPSQKDNTYVDGGNWERHFIYLVMPVSLSASISQSQEALRKKIFGNHGNIPFWLVKSKQRTAIAASNRKKIFVFQKKLLIKFFQK